MFETGSRLGCALESAEERRVASAQALAPLLGVVRARQLFAPGAGADLGLAPRVGPLEGVVIWIDNSGLKQRVCQACLPVTVLRPARSDINVWNDDPWR